MTGTWRVLRLTVREAKALTQVDNLAVYICMLCRSLTGLALFLFVRLDGMRTVSFSRYILHNIYGRSMPYQCFKSQAYETSTY